MNEDPVLDALLGRRLRAEMQQPPRLHMPRPVPADVPDWRMDDVTNCRGCLDRPKHRLRRFEHRLWVCGVCRKAWFTERDHTSEASVWYWRRWHS